MKTLDLDYLMAQCQTCGQANNRVVRWCVSCSGDLNGSKTITAREFFRTEILSAIPVLTPADLIAHNDE